jgi:hypothetical protein
MSDNEQVPIRQKVNDSLTTGHIEKSLTTAHIQQRIANTKQVQNQGNTGTSTSGNGGQQQGSGDKK